MRTGDQFMTKTRLAAFCSLMLLGGSIVASAQSQEQPLRVGGAVKPPEAIKVVAPEYPPDAGKGTVILEITINPKGLVHSARVLQEVAGATDYAIVAVSFWEYQPTLLNGEPVWVMMNVSLPVPWPE
jgi:protein TonB